MVAGKARAGADYRWVRLGIRLNIDCGSIPELANSEFGVVVESTNAVPIVVERSTYWNADGIVWAGGANVTATPVP